MVAETCAPRSSTRTARWCWRWDALRWTGPPTCCCGTRPQSLFLGGHAPNGVARLGARADARRRRSRRHRPPSRARRREAANARSAPSFDPAPAAVEFARAASVPWFAALDECLARLRPDGVILATLNALHVPQALACITGRGAGAGRVAGRAYRRRWRAPRGRGRPHAGRSCWSVITARSRSLAAACDLIARGALGTASSRCRQRSSTSRPSTSRMRPGARSRAAGRSSINLVHEIGNLRSLCGDLRPCASVASNAVRGFAVEDTVAITFRFASGALGNFLLSDTAASPQLGQIAQENPRTRRTRRRLLHDRPARGSLAIPTRCALKAYAHDDARSWFTPMRCSTLPLDRLTRSRGSSPTLRGDPRRRDAARLRARRPRQPPYRRCDRGVGPDR